MKLSVLTWISLALLMSMAAAQGPAEAAQAGIGAAAGAGAQIGAQAGVGQTQPKAWAWAWTRVSSSHGIHHICFASYCHQTQCLSSSAISHQPSATSHGRSNCLLPLPHLVPSASCLLPAASAFALKGTQMAQPPNNNDVVRCFDNDEQMMMMILMMMMTKMVKWSMALALAFGNVAFTS
ncbi:GL16090 [Drosophila persimilis]|uniref:GL16090 n=1 Tax=Drosophila persimilis TaxID=7234 RepID=B4H5H1_DROPE|nr:GL16090 [Drosophila persimilis]